ncbi:MAG: hypothetical protein QOG74_3185, partial [Alphaproteobacteria bacterium]|nr:hypothetical protein [Alphaproteobacteria bacterium]
PGMIFRSVMDTAPELQPTSRRAGTASVRAFYIGSNFAAFRSAALRLKSTSM